MLTKDMTALQRVQLSPATDWWMRGDRYGTILGIDKRPSSGPVITIELDRSGRKIRLRPDDILGEAAL